MAWWTLQRSTKVVIFPLCGSGLVVSPSCKKWKTWWYSVYSICCRWYFNIFARVFQHSTKKFPKQTYECWYFILITTLLWLTHHMSPVFPIHTGYIFFKGSSRSWAHESCSRGQIWLSNSHYNGNKERDVPTINSDHQLQNVFKSPSIAYLLSFSLPGYIRRQIKCIKNLPYTPLWVVVLLTIECKEIRRAWRWS